MKHDGTNDIHIEMHSHQVLALLKEIQSSLSNGTESAVRAVMIMREKEPGIITYEIVTQKGSDTN